jgi:CDP-4-dehydro-6-deoxyglucose reductase, E3
MSTDPLIHCDIISTQPLTDTVMQVIMLPQQKFTYLAGQYTYLVTPDGRQTPFSIANALLGSNRLEFHIRHAPDSDYSRYLLAQIKQQQGLNITPAKGECVYENPRQLAVILLAGGTGFAPMKAIIEQMLSENVSHPVYLYWGARKKNDLYLPEIPELWQRTIDAFHYIPVLSEPELTWCGRAGWVHKIVMQDIDDLKNYQVYAAGPQAMVEQAYQLFLQHGLSAASMRSDGLVKI